MSSYDGWDWDDGAAIEQDNSSEGSGFDNDDGNND